MIKTLKQEIVLFPRIEENHGNLNQVGSYIVRCVNWKFIKYEAVTTHYLCLFSADHDPRKYSAGFLSQLLEEWN
jgi:hypothetical protein